MSLREKIKTVTKAEFIGKLAKQGERYVIFVPKRYVDKNIEKLHEAKTVKIVVHDEI